LRAARAAQTTPGAHAEDRRPEPYAEAVNRDNVNGDAIRSAASAAQCWRLNQLGLLEIREEPGEPIPRDVVKELLAEAVRRGLWKPKAREAKS
jgi:hypothetical protein